MKRWFRPRTGVEDDVVWERKTAWLWFLPAKWGWGYREYANAAAHRNRLSEEMNQLSREFDVVLNKFAEAEASLRAEQTDLKKKRYNHLGIGKPILLEQKEFKEMLPFTDEPEPEWKTFVSSPVWKRILKSHGAQQTEEEQNRHNRKPKKGTVVISPSDAIEKHPEFFDGDGEQLVRWRPEANKQKSGGSNSNSNEGKKNFKQLRKDHPQESGESQNEWDTRLRGILNGD